MDGTSIEWKSDAKYLGVHLDKTLTFGLHIQKTIQKINHTVKILYPFINRKSMLSTDNKLLIYKVVFQAILYYASPVWGNCAISNIRRLQIAQNKILKMILKLPRSFSTNELHTILSMDMVSRRIAKINERYLASCTMSDNTLISNLASQ